MTVVRIFVLDKILLILGLLLIIADYATTTILFRYRAGPEHIFYVGLPISSQLGCEIILLSLWVCLNSIPNCAVVWYLS